MTEQTSTAGNNILSEHEFQALLSHLQVIKTGGGNIQSHSLLEKLGIAAGKPLNTFQLADLRQEVRTKAGYSSPEGKRAKDAIMALLPMERGE